MPKGLPVRLMGVVETKRQGLKFYPFTGAGAISMRISIKAGVGIACELEMFEVKISAAPTTSENFTVTLKSNRGSSYDVVVFSNNPSLSATTSIVNTWNPAYPLEEDDELLVEYTNTDARTIGGRLAIRLRV